jgi:hypothetical protein
VTSDPSGARVTVNGTGWGQTPVTIRHLPFGTLRVRVTKDGYVSAERTMSVGPARASSRLDVELTPRNQPRASAP